VCEFPAHIEEVFDNIGELKEKENLNILLNFLNLLRYFSEQYWRKRLAKAIGNIRGIPEQ
jgi:hypothetical protein